MAYTDHIVVDGAQYDLRDKEAVLFEPQTLTAAQREAARGNIGAGSVEDVDALKDKAADLETYVRGMSPLKTLGGSLVTVPDAAPLDAEDVLVGIEPVQSGSGDPSPDNVRPITGWTGVKVTRCGKNLGQISDDTRGSNQYISAQYSEGGVLATATGNYGRIGYLFSVKAGQEYCVSYKASGAGDFIRICYGELDAAWGTSSPGFWRFQILKQEETNYQYRFTATDSGLFFFGLYVTANGYGGTYIQVSDFQLELGSTATPYEPYAGETFSVDFPAEAGTVYGGTLDVTTGLLTVDRKKLILDGSETWQTGNWGIGYRYYTSGSVDDAKNMQPLLSSLFPKATLYSDGGISIDTASKAKQFDVRIRAEYTNFSDKASWIEYLQSNPVDVIYELATPVTYQLDPVAVAMLRGTNNLWADTGDTTLAYRQDVGLLLEALLKPDETDMTADTNYAVNSFFTSGGTLYRATAAIATGETIVPGTNCVPTTIADQLTAIYAQL